MVFAESGCYRLGRTWRKEDTNLDRSPESTMRPATYYYVAQVSPHPSHRQIQQDAAPQTTGRDRHARVPRRAHVLLAESLRSLIGRIVRKIAGSFGHLLASMAGSHVNCHGGQRRPAGSLPEPTFPGWS